MKCYYEVLEIPKDANDAEIKTAYRKMALKWHPDKNLDNSEHAKEQFQVVQQAYEVLSDRQERAWYDNHREQILRGANSEFEDNCLDVYQYFTTTCFQGYNDEEKGFYTVYRKVFEEIAKEDLEFMEGKDEFCEIPEFGTSISDYESVVKPFYDYWMSYSTKKSYSWLDPIDIREGKGNRRVMKYIEKENKKIRLQAKTQRNEEIRNLVSFVRKRDKRVQAYKKLLETKNADNRKKQEDLRKQKKLEQQRLNENQVQAEWAKFDNVQSELKEIEKHLAEQFGEEISNSDESEEEDFNNLYCIACNKVFKNPKAFGNHESSKRHKENVEKLKEVMQEEEKSSNLSDVIEEFEDFDDTNEDLNNIGEDNGIKSESESLASDESNDKVDSKQKNKNKRKNKNVLRHEDKEIINNMDEYNGIKSESEPSEESNDEVDNKKSKQKKKNKRKNKSVLRHEDKEIDDSQENVLEIESNNSESESESIHSPKKTRKKSKKLKSVILNDQESNPDPEIDINVSDDNFDFGITKQQKKKNKRINTNKNKKEENTVANEENNALENKTKDDKISDNKLSKKATKKSKILKKDITPEDLQEIDISHCCVTCKSDFSSKNKLFDHLKKAGHGVYLPPQKARQGGKKKGIAKE